MDEGSSFMANWFLFLFKRPINKFSMKSSKIYGEALVDIFSSLLLFSDWSFTFPMLKTPDLLSFMPSRYTTVLPQIRVVVSSSPPHPSSFIGGFSSWFVVLFPSLNPGIILFSVTVTPIHSPNLVHFHTISSPGLQYHSLSIPHHPTLFTFILTQLGFHGWLP